LPAHQERWCNCMSSSFDMCSSIFIDGLKPRISKRS
jgi:hypothetical protein